MFLVKAEDVRDFERWAIMSRESGNIEEHTISPLRYEAWDKFFGTIGIEGWLKNRVHYSWPTIHRQIQQQNLVELFGKNGRVFQHTETTKSQRIILKKPKLSPPKRILKTKIPAWFPRHYTIFPHLNILLIL